ncbi:hypothetical protein, partial [Klebsiella pneumoniae]|uniref:hypothetical protein n=1 Tax=Klebsiella pneumoniae TaxID=573 RepID=UPI00201057D0
GLVFCGTKTPIHNVVKLARKLGDKAKDVAKREGGNRLAYEVLESFDDVTSDFNEHRRKWLPPDLKTSDKDPLAFDPTLLKTLRSNLRTIAKSDDF